MAREVQGLYLFHIAAETSVADDGEPASLRMHLKDAKGAADLLAERGLPVLGADEHSVTLLLDEPRVTQTGAPDGWTESTFVIDYEEPSVVDMMAAQTWSDAKRPPALEELVDAVYAWIDDKTYARSFDFASKVARTRSGDCTEHAVLLAATARATGRPARVMTGLLLVDGASPAVFGHAWTEIWANNRWQLADATKPELDASATGVLYVPFGPLSDESPSYGMGMLSARPEHPTGVEWRRSAPQN